MKRLLVAAGLIAGFSALCWDASRRLAEAYPSLGRCDSKPRHYRGSEVWLPPSLVVESNPTYFRVQKYDDQARVFSPHPAKIGTYVMVYGKYRTVQTVDAIAWREEPGYPEKRLGVILISLVVVGIWAFWFRRAFEWRNGAFHPR
jgi:hypothetical protein